MNLHLFPHPAGEHPVRATAIALVATKLHGFALATGYLARFVVLSALAFLLVSAPISFREVPYAGTRPSSGA
jgi:uncharacterized membrane protein YphA (DoxX/SURF4 family)